MRLRCGHTARQYARRSADEAACAISGEGGDGGCLRDCPPCEDRWGWSWLFISHVECAFGCIRRRYWRWQVDRQGDDSMYELVKEFSVKLLAKLLPWTLRWLYTPEKIAGLIKVRISSEGSGIELWGGELPHASAWIQITNLSPFTLELERAYGSIEYGSSLDRYNYLRKAIIPPASEVRIHIEASLSQEHVGIIKRLKPSNPNPVVNFEGYFKSSVNEVHAIRRLETSHHRLVNIANAG